MRCIMDSISSGHWFAGCSGTSYILSVDQFALANEKFYDPISCLVPRKPFGGQLLRPVSQAPPEVSIVDDCPNGLRHGFWRFRLTEDQIFAVDERLFHKFPPG